LASITVGVIVVLGVFTISLIDVDDAPVNLALRLWEVP
jgi:hypothetical protein